MHASVIGGEHILLALIHDQRSMDSEFLKDFKEKYLNFDISIQSIGPGQMPPFPFGQQKDNEEEPEMDEEDEDMFETTASPSSKSKSSKGREKSDTPGLAMVGLRSLEYIFPSMSLTGRGNAPPFINSMWSV